MVEMLALGWEHVQGLAGGRYRGWGPRCPSQSVGKQDPSARLSPVPRGRLARPLRLLMTRPRKRDPFASDGKA